VQKALPYLSFDDLSVWCDELISQGLIEPALDQTPRHRASGTAGVAQGELFDQTVEQIVAALDRAPPAPAKAWAALQQTRNMQLSIAPTARMVAMEALHTTQRMTLHGFFAYTSRRADSKTKPSEFRILIVQDDHVQSQLANAIVSKEGYRVALAHSLVAFRAALRAQLRPDLVLLDVDLPDGNGFDELEALRMQPAHAKLCVMMLTGRSDEASIARGVILGANGYVTKPYRSETLLNAVRKALDLA
jgi:two-component system, OmpR family, response regulator